MAESTALVFRVRVLAITHIVVGALLIIFGIARGERYSYRHTFGARFFEIVAGTWVSVDCRNSAFLRYNLTYTAFAAVLFSRIPTRSLVAVKIDCLNCNNRFQFPRLKAFGHVF